MKILYVDECLLGHRLKYLSEFSHLGNINYYMTPESNSEVHMKYLKWNSGYDKKRNFVNYIKFIDDIKKNVEEFDIDVVHFLCGDTLYRYFGFYLNKIDVPIIVTFHHMLFCGIRKVSIKCIFKKIKYGVVHTISLYEKLQNLVSNATLIEYPMLDRLSELSVEQAKSKFSVKTSMKTLGVIGNTSRYKGLNILLTALNSVCSPCTLLIAGAATYYDEAYIRKTIKNKKINLELALHPLSDVEFADAIQASDFIVLPYTKQFDGASGPLVSGLMHNKVIIASDHGSLGQMVSENNLGYTFESENVQSLSDLLNKVLNINPVFTIDAKRYAKKLSPNNFLCKYERLYYQIK